MGCLVNGSNVKETVNSLSADQVNGFLGADSVNGVAAVSWHEDLHYVLAVEHALAIPSSHSSLLWYSVSIGWPLCELQRHIGCDRCVSSMCEQPVGSPVVVKVPNP